MFAATLSYCCISSQLPSQLVSITQNAYQVIFFGDLQEHRFVAFVVGQNSLHLLLGFQTDASEHSQFAVEHFDHFVFVKLQVDERAWGLGIMPFEG